jgi:integrase
MQEAVRQRLISTNPAKDIPMITVRSEQRKPFTDIELFKMFPKDEEKLLYIWGNRTWAVYFLIMRDTGFRPGEVAALTTECYNQELKGLYSERSIDFSTREIKERIKTTGKGKNYKVGLLTDQTVLQLNKLLFEKQYKPESLFLRVKGRPIIPDVANKHLRLSLKRADVDRKGRTQYSLRHSFETDLAGRVENSILLELMAHTNFRKEYDHRTPADILRQLQPVREVLENRS